MAFVQPTAEGDDEAESKAGPDKDAPRMQLGQEGIPPKLRKSPGFIICSVQHELPFIRESGLFLPLSVAWKHLYLTKISRGLKSEYFANQGLKQLSFGNF